MKAMRENRFGDSPFISDTLDGFLQDMAQMYVDIDYTDIMNFEHSIQDATDPRIKALRKLYKRACAAAEHDDEDEFAEIAVDVEDLVDEFRRDASTGILHKEFNLLHFVDDAETEGDATCSGMFQGIADQI